MAGSSADQTISSRSDRWYELLNGLGYDPRHAQSLAQRTRVQSIDAQIGRILAEVYDRDRGVCPVEIEVIPFRDEEWAAVLDALAGEALYAAQLLAGDMPAAIESVFADANLSLLPSATAVSDDNEIITRCGVCSRQNQPCKHVAVVLYLYGQMIAENPWLLFRLRGRDRQQILAGLRRRRNDNMAKRFDMPGAADLNATGHADGATAQLSGAVADAPSDIELGKPIEQLVAHDTFWGRSQDLRALHYHINPPPIRLTLLRRLGPPPFSQESIETYQRLADIYQKVSQRATDLAFAPEPDGDDTQ